MVVPDDDLVALLLEHEHNNVRLVHHLDQADSLADLNFFLELGASRIILDYFEAFVSRNGEVFLCLVRRDCIDRGLALRVSVGGTVRNAALLIFHPLCFGLLLEMHRAE